jgi:hypothetical protein
MYYAYNATTANTATMRILRYAKHISFRALTKRYPELLDF